VAVVQQAERVGVAGAGARHEGGVGVGRRGAGRGAGARGGARNAVRGAVRRVGGAGGQGNAVGQRGSLG
jgi:hypothetical protein